MTHTDEESRVLIVEDLDSTVLVDAGAGSGKTTSMVNRIMAILLSGRADVREIVAITFTNEGAASLKNKIRHELELAVTAEVYRMPGARDIRLSEVERKRIAAALPRLPLAQFSTIHGFCLRLLKERPIESGIDPGIEMNTDGAAITVFNEAWAAFLVHSARTRNPFLEYSREHGIDIDQVKEMAHVKCEHPDLTMHTEPTSPLRPAEVDQAFDRVTTCAGEMYSRIHLLQSDTGTAIGRERVESVANLYNGIQGRTSRQEKLAFLLDADVVDTWKQSQRSFEEQSREALDIVTKVKERVLNAMHFAMAGFVGEFEEFYLQYKKRSSALDFEDLLLLARNLVRDHSDVREDFKKQFRYVFIDEAQDTDHLQTELVFFLAERPGTCARKWSDVRLESGKLFMVGDPKQSIYRFRRADISMYEESKKIVISQGGNVLTLSRNFRAVPPIIDFVNRHFSRSFERFAGFRELGIQPVYEPLEATRPGALGPISAVGTIAIPRRSNQQGFLEAEIGALVMLIERLTGAGGPHIADPVTGESRGIHYGDIMILMKAMTDFPEYETAFEDAGIPHFQVGGKTFFLTEDIRGLIFSLKAIDDTLDTVSLFGALRSSVFGLSDQDIFETAMVGKGLRLFMDTAGIPALVEKALIALRTLRTTREALRPSGVLRELLNLSGVSHVVLGERNGVQKTARHFRLLELLMEIEAGNRTHTYRSCLAGLDAIMQADDPQLANVVLTPAAENAVKITTIHKAKGLESPVVVLAGGRSTEGLGKSGISHIVLREANCVIIPFREIGGYYSLDRKRLRELEGLKEHCEAERLRYVAATRARDLLVVCTPTEPWKGAFNGKFAETLLQDESIEHYPVPEKPLVHRPTGGRKSEAETMFTESLERRKHQLEETRVVMERCASRFVPVHELMDDPGELFTRGHRKSRGKGFGIVFHRMMERAVADAAFDPHMLIDQWMEEEHVPGRLKEDLLGGFVALNLTSAVVEAKHASEKYCEWEFFRTLDGRIVTGVIDLVYKRHGGGWIIVDYKTDDISDPARKNILDEYYAKQLALYAESFAAITGEGVGGTEILYIDGPTGEKGE